MTFRVGQKVVCVNGSHNPDFCRGERFPIKGRIYTIRGVDQGYVVLEELSNKPLQYSTGFLEMYFNPDRFRPLVEKKTDISSLIKIAEDITARGRVTA